LSFAKVIGTRPTLASMASQKHKCRTIEVVESFTYSLCGLLIGEAKHGTVRASVFAPAPAVPESPSTTMRLTSIGSALDSVTDST
jgi:hypothetical protein